MYTNQEKREIERVLTVFEPYIEQADFMEIIWSQKIQRYVFLFLDIRRETIEEAEPVDTADMICDRIYSEIGNDVMLESDKECPLWQAADSEKTEFLRRVQPYDAQLPEYHFLVKQLLTPQGAPEQD